VVNFEEIKQRVTIEEILTGCGFEPKKNRMACPIHNGQNPTSFSFSDHVYYCHSCGASGGLIDLVQILQNTTREGALEYLAKKASLPFHKNYPISNWDNKRRVINRQVSEEKSDLRDFQLIFNGLVLLREYFTQQIKQERTNLRDREIELPTYYAECQYVEYILEELDGKIALTRYDIGIEKKKLREKRDS
jgi:hypothetical protein